MQLVRYTFDAICFSRYRKTCITLRIELNETEILMSRMFQRSGAPDL